MLEQWIEAQAAKNPRAIALAAGLRSYNYGELASDIRRCSGWLKTLKLERGCRVALQLSDVYAYWILFYALEAHQVITVGVNPSQQIGPVRVASTQLEHVFADDSRPEGLSVGWTRVHQHWYLQMRRFRDAPLPKRVRRHEDPICIVLSSGTTGAAKKVMLDRRMLERRTEVERASGTYATGPGRTLASMPPSSIAALQLGLGSFAAGAALCIRIGDEPWAGALQRLKVDVLVLAPMHIDEMLANLPADFTPAREIAVFVVGGTLSEHTIQELQRRVSRNIIQGYGTTESSGVTQGHIGLMTGAEDAAGFVNPWMEVSLIDEAGEECAPGSVGEVRVRGETVVDGYLEDDEQNLKSFRSGWYHPGDLAVRDQDGILRVVGRLDDIVNLGGLKVVPANAETILRGCEPNLTDVAVFSAADPGGRLRIWVAFVGIEALGADVIARALPKVPDVRTIRRAEIPRNFLGKIERTTLRRWVEADASRANG